MVRSLEQNSSILSVALLVALAALLVLSPAEATLGNVVKIVYLHGATERISTYAFLLAALIGIAQIVFTRPALARWTRASLETAIVFWLAEILVSLPAQVLAWGGLVLNEPRVIGAIWILGLAVLVYVVARWLDDPNWMALSACAALAIVFVVLKSGINILHPFSPIVASDSMAIKVFYAAIVVITGALAVQFARFRAGAKAV